MEAGNATVNAAQAQRWNGASGQYWIEHRERHYGEHQRLVPHLFSAAAIAPGKLVLDVGCGCGHTTIMAAQAAADGPSRTEPGRPGAAVGLDLSAPMLAVARHEAIRAGVTNARFVRGDAQMGPLRSAAFDVIISSFGVMFFDDPCAAFASLATAARPDGRLAFLCWQDDRVNEMFAIPLNAFSAYTELPAPSADKLFDDPAQTAALLCATGWKDVRVAPVHEAARLGDDVDDVMGYVQGMPVIRALVDRVGDPVVSEHILATVASEYRARQRHDGIWVHAAAWLVTAYRA